MRNDCRWNPGIYFNAHSMVVGRNSEITGKQVLQTPLREELLCLKSRGNTNSITESQIQCEYLGLEGSSRDHPVQSPGKAGSPGAGDIGDKHSRQATVQSLLPLCLSFGKRGYFCTLIS